MCLRHRFVFVDVFPFLVFAMFLVSLSDLCCACYQFAALFWLWSFFFPGLFDGTGGVNGLLLFLGCVRLAPVFLASALLSLLLTLFFSYCSVVLPGSLVAQLSLYSLCGWSSLCVDAARSLCGPPFTLL